MLLQIYFARILGVIVVADYARIVVVAQLVSILTTYSFNHALIGIGYSVQGFKNLLLLTAIQMAVITSVWVIAGIVLKLELSEEYFRLALLGSLYVIGSMALIPTAHTLNCSIEAETWLYKNCAYSFYKLRCRCCCGYNVIVGGQKRIHHGGARSCQRRHISFGLLVFI